MDELCVRGISISAAGSPSLILVFPFPRETLGKGAALKPDGSPPELTNEVVWNVRAKWKFGEDSESLEILRSDGIRVEDILHFASDRESEDV